MSLAELHQHMTDNYNAIEEVKKRIDRLEKAIKLLVATGKFECVTRHKVMNILLKEGGG